MSSARLRARESRGGEKGRERAESEGRDRGGYGAYPDASGAPRWQAGGGQGGVGARHRAASVRGEEDVRGVSGGGWAASWSWARWAER